MLTCSPHIIILLPLRVFELRLRILVHILLLQLLLSICPNRSSSALIASASTVRHIGSSADAVETVGAVETAARRRGVVGAGIGVAVVVVVGLGVVDVGSGVWGIDEGVWRLGAEVLLLLLL